jgi:hypothetical protein
MPDSLKHHSELSSAVLPAAAAVAAAAAVEYGAADGPVVVTLQESEMPSFVYAIPAEVQT